MKQLLPYIFIFLFYLFCGVSVFPSSILEHGSVSLDLEELQSGKIDLTGEVFFYPNQLSDFDDIQQATSVHQFLFMGHSWNSVVSNYTKVKARGVGTYYFKIVIPQELVGESFMVRPESYISSASNITVNGISCGGNGIVDYTSDNSSYEPSRYFKAYSFTADTCVLDVLVQCANFHEAKGGILHPLVFGLTEHVIRDRQLSVICDLFITFSLLIISVYHFIAYFINLDRKELLYYSLLCLFIALDVMFIRSNSFLILFPHSPYSFFSYSLIIPYFVPALTILFIGALFPGHISKKLVISCFSVAFTCSLITIFGNVQWKANIIQPFFICVSILMLVGLMFAVRLVKIKVFAARFFFCAYLFLTLCLVHDVLDMFEIISSSKLFSLGILCFVFFLAILYGKRSVHFHSKLLLAASGLEQKKEELEEKVTLRNTEIKKSLEDLKQLHTFQESVTNIIAHDLKKSLQNVIHIEDIDPEAYPELRNSGYRMLNTVHNMLDIYRYNNKRVTVRKHKFRLHKPVDAALADLSFVIKKKELTVDLVYEADYELDADLEIFKKVFVNLLSNSCRYSPKGGLVRIKFSSRHSDILHVSVSNEGAPLNMSEKTKVFSSNFIMDDIITLEGKKTLLSLHFCKLAIEAHNGSIGVDFNDNIGVTLWFSLSGVSIIQAKNEAITENITFTLEDCLYLNPFVQQLQGLEIFDSSKITKVLIQISPLNDNISNWCDRVNTACYQIDNDLYRSLLKMI